MKYDDLSREQLLNLLQVRDAEQPLGLVWERNAYESEAALNSDFVAMDLDPNESSGPGPWNNILIVGENFDALRWLRMTCRAKVKLIYIDPNYNTLNRDWVYNDHFVGEDDAFKHSKWLEWVSQRLTLAKDLLAPDGAIFVSIDDHEGPYLKVLMDQIFGTDMFVATFIWKKVDSPNHNTAKIAPDHEYVHCYASKRARERWRRMSSAAILEGFKQVDENGRLYRDRILRKNGNDSTREKRQTMYFAIIAPDDTKVYPKHETGVDGRWSHSIKGVERLRKENRLIWKRSEELDGSLSWVPYAREFAKEDPEKPYPTIWDDVKTSRQTKAHHKEMFPGIEPFVTVKPEELVARIMEMSTKPGDLCADFFLGSGTTAAVAMKMGRRWIGIERTESTAAIACERLLKVAGGEGGGISDIIGWEGGEASYAKLRPRLLPFESLSYDLLPEHIWLAIQTLHGFPLSSFSPGQPLNICSSAEGAVAYCDRFTPEAEAQIAAAMNEHQFLIIYTYASVAVTAFVGQNDRVEIRTMPDHLIRSFQV